MKERRTNIRLLGDDIMEGVIDSTLLIVLAFLAVSMLTETKLFCPQEVTLISCSRGCVIY